MSADASNDESLLVRHTPGATESTDYAPLTPFRRVDECLRSLAEAAGGRIGDDERERILTLAACLERADRRTVVVSAETVDAVFAARDAAHVSFTRSPLGTTVAHAPAMIAHGVKNAATTGLFDMNDAKWDRVEIDGVHESDTGTIHAVKNGEVRCTRNSVDRDAVDIGVNLALLCRDDSVCGNCEPALHTAGEEITGGSFKTFEPFLQELCERSDSF